MVLKRVTGLLSRRPGSADEAAADLDTPEANAARGVRLFCESGGPNNSSEEIQYLPDIVTAAECSPAAASSCAYQIRKCLSKDNYSKPHVQYNAVMLIRILADNPGPTFTRNVDAKFVATVKELLRTGRDHSVQQILRETLYALERDKAYDTNLNPLFAMWRKEQTPQPQQSNSRKVMGNYGPRRMNAPPWHPNQAQAQGFGDQGVPQQQPPPPPPPPQQPRRLLPPPSELAARIEEARTSAKLLLQLIQSTPPAELPANELIKEFGERCQQAQRSVQGYINCASSTTGDDSSSADMDDETMLTLIETNEQLSLALTKHQRALLAARRTNSSNSVVNSARNNGTGNGINEAVAAPVAPISPPSETGYFPPPPGPPPPAALQASPANRESPPTARSSGEASAASYDNPFADSHAQQSHPLEPSHYGGATATTTSSNGMAAAGDGRSGNPSSYHPGYRSTPSYLERQESADVNRTMHGGAFSPVSEEDGESGAATGSLAAGGPPDVSPVEERRVVYRY